MEKKLDRQYIYNRVTGLLNDARLDEAETLLNQSLAQYPDDSFLLNKKGVVYARRGDYPLAESFFARVIALDPLNASAWSNLGNVSLNTGRVEQAILQYERAIAIDPNYTIAYENLSAAYRQQGNLEQSVKVMKRTKLTHRSSSFVGRLIRYLRNMGT